MSPPAADGYRWRVDERNRETWQSVRQGRRSVCGVTATRLGNLGSIVDCCRSLHVWSCVVLWLICTAVCRWSTNAQSVRASSRNGHIIVRCANDASRRWTTIARGFQRRARRQNLPTEYDYTYDLLLSFAYLTFPLLSLSIRVLLRKCPHEHRCRTRLRWCKAKAKATQRQAVPLSTTTQRRPVQHHYHLLHRQRSWQHTRQ